jgi:hypothetical protein
VGVAGRGGDHETGIVPGESAMQRRAQGDLPPGRVHREQQDTEGVGREIAVVVELARDLRQGFGVGVVFEEEPHHTARLLPAAVAVRAQPGLPTGTLVLPEELGAAAFGPPLRQPAYLAVAARLPQSGRVAVRGQGAEEVVHAELVIQLRPQRQPFQALGARLIAARCAAINRAPR